MKWIRVGLILGALGLGGQTLLHVSIARAADERVTRANVSANDWGGGCWYVVRRGDNLFRIAIRHGVSYWYLAQINGLYNPNYIWAGQMLNVPCGAVPPPALPPPPTACNPSTAYLVKPGDNLFRIAYNHGVTINALRDANNLWGRVLRPNTTLIIPCPGSVQYGNQAPAPAPPAPPAPPVVTPAPPPPTTAPVPPTAIPPRADATVNLQNGQIAPTPVEIKVGQTVLWVNQSNAPLTILSGIPGQPNEFFASPPLPPGGFFVFQFDAAGNYSYYISENPMMVGQVNVSP